MNYYFSKSTNPYFNAQFEKELFQIQAKNDLITLFYINDVSVFIGRYQNPFCELNWKEVNADKVPVIRRISGGGAVFHDLGNLNISVMGPGRHFDKQWGMANIYQFIRELGFDVSLNDRGDGLLEGKKISGSAYKYSKDSMLHHFTILMQTNQKQMWKYLKSKHPGNINSKSIQSRRVEVKNLDQFSPEELINKFVQKMGAELKILNPQYANEEIEHWKSKEWLVEETPEFSLISLDQNFFMTAKRGKWVSETSIKDGDSIELDCPLSESSNLKRCDRYDLSPFLN